MFDFLSIKKSIDVIAEKHRILCAEIEATEGEIVTIRNARANRKDVIRTIEQWVNDAGAMFGPAVASYVSSGHRYSQGSVQPYGGGFFGLLGGEPGGSMVPNMDACMCALFGDQIKRAIVAEIESTPWPDEGLPGIERASTIAKLENKVKALRQEVKAMQESASQAGIDL